MFWNKKANNLIPDRHLKESQYKQIFIDDMGSTYFLKLRWRGTDQSSKKRLIHHAIKVEILLFLKEIFFPITLLLSIYFLLKNYFTFSLQHYYLFSLFILLTVNYVFLAIKNLPIRVYLRYTYCLVDNNQVLRQYYFSEESKLNNTFVNQLTEKFKDQRVRYQNLIKELVEQHENNAISDVEFYSLLRELSYIANYQELRTVRTHYLYGKLSKLTYKMDLETDRLIPNDKSYSREFLSYLAQVCYLDIDKFGQDSAIYFLQYANVAKLDEGIGMKSCIKLAYASLQYVDNFDKNQKALLEEILIEGKDSYLSREQKKLVQYYLKSTLGGDGDE